ncbi:MAG: hypothetical protein FWD55_07240, partial [Propionibacteriaceae bacterium]|nr:hypothetical protein [Propionibacteriaceae bacterium]
MSILSQTQSHDPKKKRRFGRSLVATTVAAALFMIGVIVAVPTTAKAANGEDRLRPGETLVFGQSLISPNGEHRVGFDASGFLILSWRGDGNGKDALGGHVRWKSSRGSGSSSNARLTLDSDGVLQLRGETGTMVPAASYPQPSAGSSLIIRDDGSFGFVNRDGSAGPMIVAGVAAWAYPTHSTPTYRMDTGRRLNP